MSHRGTTCCATLLRAKYGRSRSPRPTGVGRMTDGTIEVRLVSIIANRHLRRPFMNSRHAMALQRALQTIEKAGSKQRQIATLTRDRVLRELLASMVAARTHWGMTQEEVAARMWTTKSAVSRLESGRYARPTLATIEKYALAVGARLEIRLRLPR